MRLLAPPPRMKPTRRLSPSRSAVLLLYIRRCRDCADRRRSTSSSKLAVELFTTLPSGNAPHDLRDDVADCERGRDCEPWLTTHELAQVQVNAAILDVLLRAS